jgi:Na+-transporting NADH:ubiquinone oxidoreductase subunit F
MLIISIIVSVLVFSAVILLLAAGLLTARKKLVPQGEVNISVNGGSKVLSVQPGSSLLTALSIEKVFLPSACGGGGTCAMCKCQVTEGGGDILGVI